MTNDSFFHNQHRGVRCNFFLPMLLKVQSRSDPSITYDVDTDAGTCTCPDYVHRSKKSGTTYICKHIRDMARTHTDLFPGDILDMAVPTRHSDMVARNLALVLSWLDGEYSVSKKDGSIFAIHGGDSFDIGKYAFHLSMYEIDLGAVAWSDDGRAKCGLPTEKDGLLLHVPVKEFPYAKVFQLLEPAELCEVCERFCDKGLMLTPRGVEGGDVEFESAEGIVGFVGFETESLWNWYSGVGRKKIAGKDG